MGLHPTRDLQPGFIDQKYRVVFASKTDIAKSPDYGLRDISDSEADHPALWKKQEPYISDKGPVD